MIQWLAFAFVAITGAQTPHSWFEEVIGHATGNNGYEEYIRAADIVRTPTFYTYQGWTPNRYEEALATLNPPGATNEELREIQADPEIRSRLAFLKRLDGMTKLQVWKEGVEKFGKALDYVSQGNRKKVYEPRSRYSVDITFPELAYFKNVAKLADMAAFVAFAEGRPRQGTQWLLDSYEFGTNLEGGVLISSLVGIAIESICLTGLERHLDAISRDDAVLIESRITSILAGPPPLLRTVQLEKQFCLQLVSELLSGNVDPSLFLAWDQEETEETKAVFAQIKKLTGSQRQALLGRATAALDQRMSQLTRRFEGPESGWIPAEEMQKKPTPPPAKNVTELVDQITEDSSGVFAQAGLAAARSRTQLRLLGLCGSVIRYKWDNGDLPTTLAEAAGKDRMKDPLSGQEFGYERQGAFSFRVFSRGNAQTGEFGLRWKRSGMESGRQTVPPPSRT